MRSLPLPPTTDSSRVPLVFATGAGAEMRHAIGISVFFGMLGVTAFGLLLTPSLFVMVQEATARWQHPRANAHPEIPHDPNEDEWGAP